MLNQDTQISALAQQATYTDMGDLARLRQQSQKDPRAVLENVARQFEGLFLQMMLKSMRDASFGDPLFDSSQGDMYRDMFDKQISLNMTQQKGLGLADAMVRQMGKYLPPERSAENAAPAANSYRSTISQALPATPSPGRDSLAARVASSPSERNFDSPRDFVEQLWPLAQSAAQELDTSPEFLVAQAALETGWGKYMLRHPDGSPANNLFNIKAGQNWQGRQVVKQTLEYHDGIPVQERARFRAYDSIEESFADYVDFLRSNPRYAEALQQAGSAERFAHSLQRAGYATDPEYADKIIGIMQRNVIPQTLAVSDSSEQAVAG